MERNVSPKIFGISGCNSNLNAATTYSNIFTDCEFYSGNTSGTAAHGGVLLASSGVNTFTNCEIHANRGGGVINNVAPQNTFNGCLFGTKGVNGTADVVNVSSTFNTAIFTDSNFGSSSPVSNYLNMAAGSEIRFHRFNDTDNNHRWYTTYGYAEAEDTVIRSPGLSVKINPENLAYGFTWQFQIPVLANSQARFAGFFLKNASLGAGVTTVSMYLPGNPVSSGNPDATQTLDNSTGTAFGDGTEQSIDISAFYAGDIPGAAEIVVNVKSDTAGAALYADDFFNAGDRLTTFDQITGLNLWVDGKPISVISPTVPNAADNAAATWNYLLANATTPSSFGWLVKKLLTVSKFIGLK